MRPSATKARTAWCQEQPLTQGEFNFMDDQDHLAFLTAVSESFCDALSDEPGFEDATPHDFQEVLRAAVGALLTPELHSSNLDLQVNVSCCYSAADRLGVHPPPHSRGGRRRGKYEEAVVSTATQTTRASSLPGWLYEQGK